MDTSRDVVYQKHAKCLHAKTALVPIIFPSSFNEDPTFNFLTIDQLLQNNSNVAHGGSVLLARSIAPAIRRKASINGSDHDVIQFVLDDPDGKKAIILYVKTNKDEEERLLPLPPGTIFSLKSPHLIDTSEEKVALFCRNVEENLAVLEKGSQLTEKVQWKASIFNSKIAEDFKEEGNAFFKSGKYQLALDRYNKAIEQDPTNAVFYSNRSAVNALLHKYSVALEDAEKGLALDETNSRLHYRKARALYLLKRYQDCLGYLDSDHVKTFCKGDESITELKDKVNEAYQESNLGVYDLVAMCKEAENSPFLDHAEYFDSNMVEITPAPGYPHAVIAKQNIPCGTLVFASKALFYSPVRLAPCSLPRYIAEKLNADPTIGRLFYKLYAGTELRCLEKYDENDPVQLARIYQIVDLYMFNDSKNCGIGFWIMPAFLNPICVDSTCDRFTVGDFMFVRTTKDVKKGEQILLQKYPLNDSFEQRDQFYRKHGNVCNCRLCLLESCEGPEIRKKVLRILRKIDDVNFNAFNPGRDPSKMIRDSENLFKEAQSLRPNSATFNPLADWANFILGSAYYQAGQIQRAIPINCAVFEARTTLGWVMNTMEVAQTLAMQNMAIGNRKQCKYWFEKLKAVGRIYYGDERMLCYLLTKNMAQISSFLFAMFNDD